MENIKNKIYRPFIPVLSYNPHTFRFNCGMNISKLVIETIWFDMVYTKQKVIIDNQVEMSFLLTMQSIKLKL